MKYIAVAFLAYLIGSINSSIIVGRLWKNVDVRKLGSGNAGATNILRTLGKAPAVLVIIGDALKGVIAVILGSFFIGDQPELGAMIGGIAAVAGHNWPVFFQFKGGKGILTSAAVILMVAPNIGIFVVIISILIIAITRYVSLGSMMGSILFPVFVLVMETKNTNLLIFSIALAVLAIYRHRENLKRLLNGTESKIESKRKLN